MNRSIKCYLVTVLLSLAVASLLASAAEAPPEDAKDAQAAAATWPQWRGPTRDGKVAPCAWPADLKGLRQVWRVELAESYSGPIVAADRVFTTETVDRRAEVVRALDRRTGEEIWSRPWPGAMKVPFFAARNGSWIRSTPAWDGTHLYVAGMRDVLVCLEGKTGEVVWRVDFKERYKTPLPAFGYVSSPLVVGDHVYVQAGASFVKLDKRTGAEAWRTLKDGGGMYGSAFSSPVLAQVAGQEQLLVQTRRSLAGVAAADGRVLWSVDVPAFRGMNILTPIAHGDLLFTSTYKRGSFGYRVTREGEKISVAPAWKNRAQGYMSTPQVIDGHAYLQRRDKRMSCIELATGTVKWTSKERFGTYASFVSNGDRILGLTDEGELVYLRANTQKLEMIARRKVAGEPTWAHLAVAGDEVFIRELKAMSAWKWE